MTFLFQWKIFEMFIFNLKGSRSEQYKGSHGLDVSCRVDVQLVWVDVIFESYVIMVHTFYINVQ